MIDQTKALHELIEAKLDGNDPITTEDLTYWKDMARTMSDDAERMEEQVELETGRSQRAEGEVFEANKKVVELESELAQSQAHRFTAEEVFAEFSDRCKDQFVLKRAGEIICNHLSIRTIGYDCAIKVCPIIRALEEGRK